MLPKANRLKAKGEFKRTLSGRRLCGNQFFVLYGLAAQSTAGPSVVNRSMPRVGFIVSKKIHKRATKRNRIRRQLRELVRSHIQQNPHSAFPGYRALVFIARPGSLEGAFSDLKHKMERCLQSLRP